MEKPKDRELALRVQATQERKTMKGARTKETEKQAKCKREQCKKIEEIKEGTRMQQTKRTRAKREEKKINHDDTGKKELAITTPKKKCL